MLNRIDNEVNNMKYISRPYVTEVRSFFNCLNKAAFWIIKIFCFFKRKNHE
jgi:hypothetical protein